MTCNNRNSRIFAPLAGEGASPARAPAATFRACDTAVFLLQSSAAARKWPSTPKKLEGLKAAFRETNGKRGSD